jgi:hypothetical protein
LIPVYDNSGLRWLTNCVGAEQYLTLREPFKIKSISQECRQEVMQVGGDELGGHVQLWRIRLIIRNLKINRFQTSGPA